MSTYYGQGKHPNTNAAIREPQAAALALKRSQQARSARAKFNALIDLKLGDGGEEALDLVVATMRGELVCPARKPSPGEDALTYASTVPMVGPTVRERLEAAQWLLEHRNGRPRQTLEVEGQGAIVAVPVNLSAFSDQELEIAELLLTKGQQKDPDPESVDAEFTEIER